MSADTIMQNQALVGLRSVARAEFVVHVGNGRIDLLTPVPAFGKLLRAQSNEDAEDNHPHLAEQCAPAVQRFWKLEMCHAAGPPAVYRSLT